jgi:hypothetical protein
MSEKWKQRWMFIIKVIVIIFIALHIYGTHARLLYKINPEATEAIKNVGFSFFRINEYTMTAQAFGLVYGIITAGIIFLYSEHKKKFMTIITFSILDGFGMFVYYSADSNNLFIIFAAIYYCVYTFCIIMAVGLHKSSTSKSEVETEVERNELIIKMKEHGLSGKEIAEIVGLTPSMISRIISKSH